MYLDNNMIGCKPLCFFGEVPPRQERTKKKPYAGGNRAGTACGQTDTEEEPGKLAERTSQSFVCQVVRRKSAESATLCAGQGRQPCPVDVMPASYPTGYYLAHSRRQICSFAAPRCPYPAHGVFCVPPERRDGR